MKLIPAILLACFVLFPAVRVRCEDAPADAKPLLVNARIKSGKSRPFETRILEHLDDFSPGGTTRLSDYGGWRRTSRTGRCWMRCGSSTGTRIR